MKKRFDGDTPLVYSTEQGRLCGQCGKARAACVCRQQTKNAPPPVGDGVVRVSLDTKGRKGKGMTLVSGLPLTEAALGEVARRLKARCGCGGTVKNGIVEIQGDHRDTVAAELAREGYRVKRAGG